MVHLAAQTEDIRAKATTVQQQAAEAEAMLGKLSAALGELNSTWQGPASHAFHQLYESWAAQARNMQQTLEGIGRSLNSAGTNYEQLESQIASSMR
jgi:WXG100 family type VII secretion target